MPPTPPSRPGGQRARRRSTPPIVRDATRALGALRAGLGKGARTVVHWWLSSLQFKVVVTTMLLGLIVVGVLGMSLYRQIASGLVTDRVNSAESEAARYTQTLQATFDSADKLDNETLTQIGSDMVGQIASPGEDYSRMVILTRAEDNNGPRNISTLLSAGSVPLKDIPETLRSAVAADPQHQQVQIAPVHPPAQDSLGEQLPAVIVGSRVSLPRAGAYDLYFVFPMQREEATLHVVGRTFWIGGTILVILVGAVAYVVTRLVVDPVRRTAHVSQRLAAGDLGERLRVRGTDEVATLATSFNAMADSLQMQIRQLEDLSRVQQRFVSDVSHELRTPLTTIRMAGEVLHDSREDFTASVARSAELLHREIDRFESLLTDLLEISRFDAGAAALETATVDLREVVERVVDGAASLAEHRGSTVTVHAPAGPCSAEIDRRRVARILRNLVVNAIEHGEGRPISVTVGGNDEAVAVAVRDHGVGLRPGESSLVFNRFWRADPARARNTGGTGLGLSISLEDARLHDGWLQAWGEPGTGSCFRLTLPRHVGTPIVESPVPLSPYAGSSGDRGDGAGPSGAVPLPPGASATPPSHVRGADR